MVAFGAPSLPTIYYTDENGFHGLAAGERALPATRIFFFNS
jgi:hypothetical protein